MYAFWKTQLKAHFQQTDVTLAHPQKPFRNVLALKITGYWLTQVLNLPQTDRTVFCGYIAVFSPLTV